MIMMRKRGPVVGLFKPFCKADPSKCPCYEHSLEEGDVADVFLNVLSRIEECLFEPRDKSGFTQRVLSTLYAKVYIWKDFCDRDVLLSYLRNNVDDILKEYAQKQRQARLVMTRALLCSPLRNIGDLRHKIMVEYVRGMHRYELNRANKSICYVLSALRNKKSRQ